MNYYQHHISDFNNATRHLSLIKLAMYRDLIKCITMPKLPWMSGILIAWRASCSLKNRAA